jgi:coenzyme PQQ synthesis protein D (PqqD)
VPEMVVRRAFGSETVLLNLQTGQYHGLNMTGARMLDLLEETGDAPATARQVALEADVPEEIVAGDLAELCGQLLERGLIEIEAP